MCIQIMEVYAVCHCLYHIHEVDTCASYRRRGHKVQTREVLVGHSCAKHCLCGTGQASYPPRVERSDERRRGITSPRRMKPNNLEESSLRSTNPSNPRQNSLEASEHASETGLSIAGPPPPPGKSLLPERIVNIFSTAGQTWNDVLSAAGSLKVSGRVRQTEGQASSFFIAFPSAYPPSAAPTELPFSSGREGKLWSPSSFHQTEVTQKSQAAQLQTDILDGKDYTVSLDLLTMDPFPVPVLQNLRRSKNYQYAQSWIPKRWWWESATLSALKTPSQLFGLTRGNMKERFYALSIFGFDFSISVTTELGSPNLLRNCSMRIEKPLGQGRKRIRWICVSSHRGYCCDI
jgi:hypothetical protein